MYSLFIIRLGLAGHCVKLSDSLDSQLENLRQTGRGLATWAGCSVLLIFLFALSRWHHGIGIVVSTFSLGALVALAFGSVGILVGFLFGIPRTLQSDSTLAPPKAKDGQAGGNGGAYRQNVNTNLEQISDWLTKILVGVGLTQLGQMPQKLTALARYFQPGFNNSPSATLVVLLNSLVLGFFAGYLLTRLFLASAFRTADPDPLRGTEQFARGLTEAGAYGKAIVALEEALKQVGSDTPKEVKRHIYESLVYNYLYEPPPTGFRKAIEYATGYIQQEPNTPSAKICAYLAAAYGQQYADELAHEKRPDVLEAAKKNALNAIQTTLKLEPKMKSFLRPLWDPNDPAKEPSQEDDLEPFYTDEDFKRLLS